MSAAATQNAADPTKVWFKGRSRWGSPFVALAPGRPGDAGYDPNAKKKVNLTLLVPKSDTVTLVRINAALDAGLTNYFGSKRPPRLRVPISDGDERTSEGQYRHPTDEFRGQMLVRLTANEDRMPVVLKGPSGQQTQAKPGDYAPGYWLTVIARTFCYNVSGNAGASLGVNAVNITAEDIVFAAEEPIADLDAALAGEDLPVKSAPAGPREPPSTVDPAAQFA
jgi:hypothetical protein